jgi:hypothetical protein
MASYDFQTGLSGAASGAGAGATVGSAVPGIGTAIGAGVGGLVGAATGFFGGGSEASPVRDRAIEENRKRLQALIQERKAAEDRSPTDTTFFNTGVAELQEQAGRQADRDAAQAAARGLSGSQFELAQANSRRQTRAEALRGLLRSSAQIDRQQERQAQRQVQRQRESLNALVSDQAQAQERRSARRGQALRQTFSNLPFLLEQADFGFGEDAAEGGAIIDSTQGVRSRSPIGTLA